MQAQQRDEPRVQGWGNWHWGIPVWRTAGSGKQAGFTSGFNGFPDESAAPKFIHFYFFIVAFRVVRDTSGSSAGGQQGSPQSRATCLIIVSATPLLSRSKFCRTSSARCGSSDGEIALRISLEWTARALGAVSCWTTGCQSQLVTSFVRRRYSSSFRRGIFLLSPVILSQCVGYGAGNPGQDSKELRETCNLLGAQHSRTWNNINE